MEYLIIAANAAAALVGTIAPSNLLPVSLPVLLLDIAALRRHKIEKEEDTISLAKDVVKTYKTRGSLLKAAEQVGEPGRRLRLGGDSVMEDIAAASSNNSKAELFGILSFGAGYGKSVARSIELFVSRLESEIAQKNRIKERIGGMQTLTYLGMMVFLPLFGGVSAGIIQTSLGIVGINPALLEHSFLMLIEAYILLMLLLTRAFSSPRSSALSVLAASLPLFLIACNVMFAAYTYVPNFA